MSEYILIVWDILCWPYRRWKRWKLDQAFSRLQKNRRLLDETFSKLDEYVAPYRGEFFKPEENP